MEQNKIEVTDSAIEFIKTHIEDSHTIRFGIIAGGCNGFSYLFDFGEQKDGDYIYEKNNIKIVIDPKSIKYVDGTVIDFNKGISNHGLKFNNPNVKNGCGCGSSITFKD